jgi:hypothetical protein
METRRRLDLAMGMAREPVQVLEPVLALARPFYLGHRQRK